jgi:dTDP-4-dehydrorhamnose 3,5-epimerase
LIFTPTPLAGAWLVELEPIADDRGFFARSFCREEFEARGLDPRIAQTNISFNRRRGTLRGLHYQAAPYAEAKLVRCTQGAIWDAIVDLRPESPTYKRWHGVELSAASRRALYVPEGFAQGFQTLADNSEVLYLMSQFYRPDAARGLRWDDPALGIAWPIADPQLSDRDRGLPRLGG